MSCNIIQIGFKEVLVVGVYLLSIIHIPRTSSAPTSRQSMEQSRMNSHPKWINPCGINDDMITHDIDTPFVPDGDLLSQILVQAKIALSEAEHFKHDYVHKTFNTDFEQNHAHWKSYNYKWLPSSDEIPKKLGEKTPNEHLESLKLDKSLLDTFESLQKIAVGLEQVVWDQEDEGNQFHAKFKDTEFKLRALLCEIQVAIIERGLTMRDDVRRDIMTEELRQTDKTNRALRDWLIFRDYMNALEYVIEVFENFQKNL